MFKTFLNQLITSATIKMQPISMNIRVNELSLYVGSWLYYGYLTDYMLNLLVG